MTAFDAQIAVYLTDTDPGVCESVMDDICGVLIEHGFGTAESEPMRAVLSLAQHDFPLGLGSDDEIIQFFDGNMAVMFPRAEDDVGDQAEQFLASLEEEEE